VLLSRDKKIQNLKWELPTLSLLYKSQYDISHCNYKVYNLMRAWKLNQSVSFLFKDTTPQPNNLSKKGLVFTPTLLKSLIRILKNVPNHSSNPKSYFVISMIHYLKLKRV